MSHMLSQFVVFYTMYMYVKYMVIASTNERLQEFDLMDEPDDALTLQFPSRAASDLCTTFMNYFHKS